ncbi:MAG TPA: hypothetical protein VLM36_11795 [Sphingomicrobium sp.]|nr:hypothetical protein [Sphingomicrobium sp.]
MHRGSVARVEKLADCAASAVLALACGFAASQWLAGAVARLPASAALAAAAYFLSVRLLGSIQPQPRRLPVAIFDVRELEPIEPIEPTELLLTERLDQPSRGTDPLLLDDILAELGPDSRVVRLFDPASMPTAGDLRLRIEKHLDGEATAARSSDAAQALHEALAELRRSIR